MKPRPFSFDIPSPVFLEPVFLVDVPDALPIYSFCITTYLGRFPLSVC
jgi:hypothetical protein